MPLYDCMLLAKPHVKKEALLDLLARVSKHVIKRNGVITGVQSFGTVHLGYGVKKLDGRFYKGQLMQMTMMATPNMNKELHYLNKEDRLLRWLLVKHRDTKYGMDFLSETEDARNEFVKYRQGSVFNTEHSDDDVEDESDDDQEENQGELSLEDFDDDTEDDESDVDNVESHKDPERKQIDG